jgi:hypothetical protein
MIGYADIAYLKMRSTHQSLYSDNHPAGKLVRRDASNGLWQNSFDKL